MPGKVICTSLFLLAFFSFMMVSGEYNNGSDWIIDTECLCGLPNEAKIVGGVEPNLHEFPWMARIQIAVASRGYLWCSGSLISDQHVLTATHCVIGRNLDDIRIILGEHDTATTTDGQTLMMWINRYLTHPNYNDTAENNNDIAIVEMATKVTFQRNIKPICLTKLLIDPVELVGLNAVVAGWGRTGETSAVSTKIQKVVVKVVSNEVCELAFKRAGNYPITANMICAGMLPAGGKDACQGDSGGPLMIKDIFTGQYYLMGIVSFGLGCGRRGIPGVYTRVDNYKTFIRKYTKKSLKCSHY